MGESEKINEKRAQFEKGKKLEEDFFNDQFHAIKAKIEHLIDEGRTYYTYNELEASVIERLVKQFHYDDMMTFR